MKRSKLIQFIKELVSACLITWALIHAMGASGMILKQSVALVAINGGR